MKAYVVTIKGLPHSEEAAVRCIASAARFKIEAEVFPATDKFEAPVLFDKLGFSKKLPLGVRDTRDPWTHRWLQDTEAGCFMSHYRLWQLCVEKNEPVIILEDDAIVASRIKLPSGYKLNHYVGIGKWPQLFQTPQKFAHLFDKSVNYIPKRKGIQKYPLTNAIGTFGYIITPEGSQRMISGIEATDRLWPADVIMSKSFIDMDVLVPQPVITSTDISAIRDNNIWSTFKK